MTLCVFSTFLSISSLTIKVISRSIAACNVPPSERVLLLYGEDCLVSEHGQVFQFLRGLSCRMSPFHPRYNKAEGLTVYDDGQENDKDIILDPGQYHVGRCGFIPAAGEVFDNKVCRFRYGHIENILLLFQREFEPLSEFGQICTESELDPHNWGLRIPQKEEDFRIPLQSSFRDKWFRGRSCERHSAGSYSILQCYLEDPLREDRIRRLLTVGFEYPLYRVDSCCLLRQDLRQGSVSIDRPSIESNVSEKMEARLPFRA